MKLAATFLLTLTALAQQVPEVRGIVTESGTTTPIPGVEVTLSEFAPNADNVIVSKAVGSTITDAAGAFSLKPGHLGTFLVGAKKGGYTAVDFRSLALTASGPVQSIGMALVRPGILTGRVIDRDGKSVPNQRVYLDVVRATTRLPGIISTLTDREGNFTATNVQPGLYVVNLRPPSPPGSQDLAAYTEADFEAADEDIETSYWPGGVSSLEQALPITIASGGIANAGTITLRKMTYYRLRISLVGSCAPNERWSFRIRSVDSPNALAVDRITDCREDALLTGIAPGSYTLAVWTGRRFDRWALVPFTITDKNARVSLPFNDSLSISGSLVPANGADLGKLGTVNILVRPNGSLPSNQSNAESDAGGKFSLERVPWKTQMISIRPSNPSSYVKEVRYNHQRLGSPEFDAGAGAPLEIVLDGGAATLSGVIKSPGTVPLTSVLLLPVATTELVRTATFPPFSFAASPLSDQFAAGLSLENGSFVINSIPPGDYRVFVLPLRTDGDYPNGAALTGLLAAAPKITLARDERKSMELQLK